VYFISQSPLDIPEDILGQLGLKIQHALRAYTPKDQQVVKSVAANFRSNPKIDTEAAIQELKTGEALVSVLHKDGSPAPVERIFIRPPESQLGPVTLEQRNEIMRRSPFSGRYEQEVDRESAYELLKIKTERQAEIAVEEQQTKQQKTKSSNRQSVGEALFKSVARAAGSTVGRQLIRGLMGSLLGGRR
jgi:hypothetical protein